MGSEMCIRDRHLIRTKLSVTELSHKYKSTSFPGLLFFSCLITSDAYREGNASACYSCPCHKIVVLFLIGDVGCAPHTCVWRVNLCGPTTAIYTHTSLSSSDSDNLGYSIFLHSTPPVLLLLFLLVLSLLVILVDLSLYFPTSTENKKCKEKSSAHIPLFYSFFTLICIFWSSLRLFHFLDLFTS